MLFYDSQPAASIDSHQRGFDGVGYEIILRTPLTIILHRIAPLAYKVSRTCLFIFSTNKRSKMDSVICIAISITNFQLLAGFDCGRDIKSTSIFFHSVDSISFLIGICVSHESRRGCVCNVLT